jgi:hypothetical protein
MAPVVRPDLDEEDDDDLEEAGGWSATSGLAKGTAATLAVAAVLAGAWSTLAKSRPDLAVFYKHDDAQVTFILILMGGLIGFIGVWLLFGTMHRIGQLIGGIPTLVVAVIFIGIVLVKQAVLASSGGRIDEVPYTGWQWLQPAVFLKSNIGAWMGLFAGVWIMRDGDSPLEVFR